MRPRPAPGLVLPPLDKPRLTSSHVLRWLAAQQNWDRIHYDQAYCREHAGLRAPVINGGLKQHFIAQFLARAFDGAGWVWRIDYQFRGPDFVGERLRVQGQVRASEPRGAFVLVRVAFEIANLDQDNATTRGDAVVVLAAGGEPVLDGLALDGLAPDLALDTGVADDASAPAALRQRLGQQIEQRRSDYAVDLSRLRLFADAVMDLRAIHFDPAAAASGPYGTVVATPLFPLHAMEARPGTLPLSEAPEAMGREGVNEVGRDPATLFGLRAAGGMNAGNRVQVHSPVRVGERVEATSTLVGVRERPGRDGGRLLFFETVNRYRETGGRPLLTERQNVVLKLP